jgi:ABC-type Mn2+/Zn2+ transport system ATPase subunit
MNAPVFVLRARELRAARGVTVATDVSLTASPGDVIAVEGPNGSGKTTLLAAAAGLLPATNVRARPASVAFSPERASLLPRISVLRWLVGLARTAGLSRADAAVRAGDLLGRLRLEDRPLHVLSRGNTQRALVAQALVSDPDLLILDEPAGGMDADGVARVAAEIMRAADRRAVVLVARHPTAPLPLPAGTTWRFADGTVRSMPRDEAVADLVEVETGDGVVRKVASSELPSVLRGALGAAHRARLLAASQWFAAPMLVFLAVLSIIYATDAGPPLQPAAVTAIALIPVATWLTVLAHRVDGRELARAFAAHAGGWARAHLATDLGVLPYAVALSVAAIGWPLASQGGHPHPALLVLRMLALLLSAALFGIGLGSLLALIDQIGWRLIVAVGVLLGLVLIQPTPLTPLLRLSTAAVTVHTPVGSQCAWLLVAAAAFIAAAAPLSTRVY